MEMVLSRERREGERKREKQTDRQQEAETETTVLSLCWRCPRQFTLQEEDANWLSVTVVEKVVGSALEHLLVVGDADLTLT